MDTQLHPRLIAPRIREALADTPVVCLLGPRQVGKTTLAKSLDPDRTYINFDDKILLESAKQDPTGFVQGLPECVILDEVQRVPELLLAIKASVDLNRKPGRFILTGSANLLLLANVQESLAGRMEIIYLQPLAEQEKQRAIDSLLERFIEQQLAPSIKASQATIEGVAEAVVQGGYPEPNIRTERRARQWHKQYLTTIVQRDVRDVAAIRDEDELLNVIQMLALRTGGLLNVSSLAKDMQIQRETMDKYITTLERLFLIKKLPAWHQNQSKRLVKTPKVHLVDSGLACALAKLKTADWHNYSHDFGPVLESFVVQQLMCQAGWSEHELQFSHYRDKDKVEVDLVIEEGKYVWGVEVKKAASIQAKDARGLARLASHAGKNWRGGMLLYTGNNTLPVPNVANTLAVPINALWT